MRLVIDTNCLLVSIPRLSETRWLYDGIKFGLFEISVTTEILEEYEGIIGEFYSPNLATNVVELLPNLKNTLRINLYYKWELIQPDLDDNKFVDCAIASQADYIITHDRHFNALKKIPFPKVEILKMNELKKILFGD